MIEVTLPGGFERDGAWQRTVWLRSWCGHDEAFLAEEAGALPPAARTTALLARCLSLDGGPATPQLARSLTVGDREALLLHLRRITLGDRLACVLTCPGCGEKMDLDLQASDLLLPPYECDYERDSGRHRATLAEDGEVFHVRFRLPNGEDQELAAPLVLEDEARAERLVLERCVEEVTAEDDRPAGEIPAAVARRLPQLMAELDPQAELRLEMACPACGAAFATLFDTAQYLHQEMAQASGQLYREVHLLAYHYHWSEAEILGMTGKQRRRYLGLLAEALTERRAR